MIVKERKVQRNQLKNHKISFLLIKEINNNNWGF